MNPRRKVSESCNFAIFILIVRRWAACYYPAEEIKEVSGSYIALEFNLLSTGADLEFLH